MANRKRFAMNTLSQFALQAARYIFPYITIPYLTRVLGPDVYAVRAYVLAAMTFMMVFLDFGFTSYGTRAIALAVKDKTAVRSETTAIMICRVVLVIVGAIVLIPLTLGIPIMAGAVAFVAVSYLGAVFKAVLPDFVFQGFEEMGIITRRFVVSQAVTVVLILLFVKGPEDLLLVAIFEALGAFIAFIWSWENVFVARKILPISVPAKKVKDVFAKSAVFFLSNAATTIFTSLTTLMIGIFVANPAEISYWSLAMTAVAAIQSLYAPITNSLYPHMVHHKDFPLFWKLLISGTIAAIVGTIVYAYLADTVMLVVGGPEYVVGSYIIVLTAPVLIFSYPAMLIGFPVLVALGEINKVTAASIISAVFHIAGLFILAGTGYFTLANIAILRCCTELLMMILRIIFLAMLMRRLKNEPKAEDAPVE